MVQKFDFAILYFLPEIYIFYIYIYIYYKVKKHTVVQQILTGTSAQL